MRIFKLKHPIQLANNHQITELNFRDYATAGDYLAFDIGGGHRQTIALIARLTGNDESLIERLHVNDYQEADRIASALINGKELELKKLPPA